MLHWPQHANAQVNLREANHYQGSRMSLKSLEKTVEQAINTSIHPFIAKFQ